MKSYAMDHQRCSQIQLPGLNLVSNGHVSVLVKNAEPLVGRLTLADLCSTVSRFHSNAREFALQQLVSIRSGEIAY
jgi:hypothetical protein